MYALHKIEIIVVCSNGDTVVIDERSYLIFFTLLRVVGAIGRGPVGRYGACRGAWGLTQGVKVLPGLVGWKGVDLVLVGGAVSTGH